MKNDYPTCNNCPRYETDIPEGDLDSITHWIEMKEMEARNNKLKQAFMESHRKEKDQIEVIPEDDTHAPECEVHVGGECNCK